MKRSFRKPTRNSCLSQILWALIPYSEENIALTFRPRKFFANLAKEQPYQINSMEVAYYRALKNGLIKLDENEVPRLTSKGKRCLVPYQPRRYKADGRLLLIFDIPETEAWKRKRLRSLLKELRFTQIQKSVWMTKYDCLKYIQAEIEANHMIEYIKLFEVMAIKLSD